MSPFQPFRWSAGLKVWLIVVTLICVVTSYRMPEHPAPNVTVLLPGYQFIEYAIHCFGITGVVAAIRQRTILLNFDLNMIESWIALTGVAFFLSPWLALLVKALVGI